MEKRWYKPRNEHVKHSSLGDEDFPATGAELPVDVETHRLLRRGEIEECEAPGDAAPAKTKKGGDA